MDHFKTLQLIGASKEFNILMRFQGKTEFNYSFQVRFSQLTDGAELFSGPAVFLLVQNLTMMGSEMMWAG